MASLITTLKDATKTNELLPRTRIKAVYDDNGNALSSSLTASDINALAGGKISSQDTAIAAKADKVTSPTNGDIAKLNASGNLVDSGIPATKVVQNDGYYKNLGAGTAEQLISTVFTEDKVPYNFRTAGGSIDIGDREEDEIVGGSIAWNQLYTKMPTASTTKNGISFTFNDDGSITVGGNSPQTATGLIVQQASPSFGNYGNNHKLLLFGCPQGGSANGFYLGALNSGEGRFDDKDTGSGTIISVGGTYGLKYLIINIESGTTINSPITFKPILIDLTTMFGSQIADYIYTLETGDAGAGVAWFRKYFPKPYYAYNAGSLESVCVSAHNTTGFNQWDEEWELGQINPTTGQNTTGTTVRSKNYINVLPSTTYYCKAGSLQSEEVAMFFYDNNKNFLSFVGAGNTTFTTPANAYFVRFFCAIAYGTTYNHDICINLHWDGERDGEYEPYVKNSYALDHTKVIRGIPKLDANNKLYYDGDVYKSDGTIERKYGIVDLGTLYWTWNSTFEVYISLDLVGKANGAQNIISSKYDTNSSNNWSALLDHEISGNSINATIYIKDSSINNQTDLVNGKIDKFDGVYAVYELATPTTESADPYTNPQIVNDFGTEEYVDYPESQGTRDVAIPVGHTTKYQPNLRAKLEMAPDSPDGDGYYAVHQDDGENEYVDISTVPVISGLTTRVPACSTGTDGTFVLKATVADGAVTYAWVEEA